MLDEFRRSASTMVSHAIDQLGRTVGTKPLIDNFDLRSETMVSLVLPDEFSSNADSVGKAGQRHPLQDWLWDKHRIEISIISWNGQLLIRISAHLYNSPTEYSQLARAVHSFAQSSTCMD